MDVTGSGSRCGPGIAAGRGRGPSVAVRETLTVVAAGPTGVRPGSASMPLFIATRSGRVYALPPGTAGRRSLGRPPASRLKRALRRPRLRCALRARRRRSDGCGSPRAFACSPAASTISSRSCARSPNQSSARRRASREKRSLGRLPRIPSARFPLAFGVREPWSSAFDATPFPGFGFDPGLRMDPGRWKFDFFAHGQVRGRA